MSSEPELLIAKDYKSDVRPVWCPGCGNYGILTSLTQAFAELQLNPDDVMFSSGIGCASRFPYFVKGYCLHGVHGRALPIAVGMKVARPELTVMVIGGDGDGLSIGGGHLAHAARKNVDLTYIISNNSIYGLTKGQTSPTTWVGQKTSTSPNGAVDPPLNPVLMMLAADATFVARGYTGKPADLRDIIVAGIKHSGFSIIEVLSPCPSFNKTLNFRLLNEMVKPLPEEHDPSDRLAAMKVCLDEDGYHTGVFYQIQRDTYSQNKTVIQERAGLVSSERVGMIELIDEMA